MKQLLELYNDIINNGQYTEDRTGIGTIAVFGRMLRFNMADGFPAVTTKKLMFKSVVSELLWMLEGSGNEHRLAEIKNDNKPYNILTEKERRTIWTDNYNNQAKALGYIDGWLGPVYGYQYRYGFNIDQIANVINLINNDPTSRRMVVTAWNPRDLYKMALPPCHYAYQFNVTGKQHEYLSLMFQMRSVDTFLGLPFDIASYGLLLHIIAKITNKIPLELIGVFGNTHIYCNHIDQVKEQLLREPGKLPDLIMPEHANYSTIDTFLGSVKTSDFKLANYNPASAIYAPMAG